MDGVDEISILKPQIFPNPTTGIVNVAFSKYLMGKIKIKDAQGSTLINQPIALTNHFDLSSFSDGVYLIEIQTENKLFLKRFVKISN